MLCEGKCFSAVFMGPGFFEFHLSSAYVLGIVISTGTVGKTDKVLGSLAVIM